MFDAERGQERETDLNLCLVGRFLKDRGLRMKAMTERMAEVWRLARGVEIKEIKGGLLMFQFYHKMDMMRVYEGGPWSFDNYMLCLGQVQPGDIMEEIPLFHLPMWVQIHDLPVGFMSSVVGTALGNFIGEFMEYDKNNNTGIWRSYMRIRVRVDTRVPLKKEKKVKRPGGDWRVVSFKYERLGVFCFMCGIIGHTEQYCDKLLDCENDDGVRGWGVEMRAAPRRVGGGG